MLFNRATRCFYTILICLATIALYAGDDPCGATNLSTSSTEFLMFDNSGNSDSGIEETCDNHDNKHYQIERRAVGLKDCFCADEVANYLRLHVNAPKVAEVKPFGRLSSA